MQYKIEGESLPVVKYNWKQERVLSARLAQCPGWTMKLSCRQKQVE